MKRPRRRRWLWFGASRTKFKPCSSWPIGPSSATELTSSLVGGGRLRVPTAGLVAIGLDADSWAQVKEGGGTLLWLLPSRLLAGGGLEK